MLYRSFVFLYRRRPPPSPSSSSKLLVVDENTHTHTHNNETTTRRLDIPIPFFWSFPPPIHSFLFFPFFLLPPSSPPPSSLPSPISSPPPDYVTVVLSPSARSNFCLALTKSCRRLGPLGATLHTVHPPGNAHVTIAFILYLSQLTFLPTSPPSSLRSTSRSA